MDKIKQSSPSIRLLQTKTSRQPGHRSLKADDKPSSLRFKRPTSLFEACVSAAKHLEPKQIVIKCSISKPPHQAEGQRREKRDGRKLVAFGPASWAPQAERRRARKHYAAPQPTSPLLPPPMQDVVVFHQTESEKIKWRQNEIGASQDVATGCAAAPPLHRRRCSATGRCDREGRAVWKTVAIALGEASSADLDE